MKKITRTLLCILLLLALFAAPCSAGLSQASAQEYVPDRTPVQKDGDYSFKVYEDGTVIIVDYSGNEQDIVIPAELGGNTVTEIGSEAFAYQEMNSLIIPEGIRVSGRAFEYCEISEYLGLPAGITVETRAFEYADLPDAVTIPEGAVISGDSFSYCEGLKTLFVEPGATLKGDAFSYSEDLRTIFCASGSTFMEDAFYSCRKLIAVVLCGEVTLDGKPFPYSNRAKFIFEEEGQYALELERAAGTEGMPVAQKGKTPSSGKKIGRDVALQIALEDAGLTADQIRDIDVELERGIGAEYYEVDFEKGFLEYKYRIDAYSGDILSAKLDN